LARSSLWTVATQPSDSATSWSCAITCGVSGVKETINRGPTYTVLRGRTFLTESAVPGSSTRPSTWSSTGLGGTNGSRCAERADWRDSAWPKGRSGRGELELM
jgi:hypothetical protein